MQAVKQHSTTDILSEIINRRKENISKLGYTFGCIIPKKRNKPIIPFLDQKGVILEIKRASPSRGDIAPTLNPAQTAEFYEKSGAAAISVLTENNFFKGSLEDLVIAAEAAPHTAILRKDFLLDEQEIDIAYTCGADAVLLIARILDTKKLAAMLNRCKQKGLTALIEVRLKSDIIKLEEVLKIFPQNCVIGVNARDLRNFTIDLLKPASLLKKIGTKVIFESGIKTSQGAQLVSSMGFHGLLLGEGAVKQPEYAQHLVNAFRSKKITAAGSFWVQLSEKIAEKKQTPLVKICGLTRQQDAVLAADLGTDFEGFIFSLKSKRYCSGKTAEMIIKAVRQKCKNIPYFIGVITDLVSKEAQEAIDLVHKGYLDALQFHGFSKEKFPNVPVDFPYYPVTNITTEKDIQIADNLFNAGNPRILIDSKTNTTIGGTGKQIDSELISIIASRHKLWLAGGINSDNVTDIIRLFHPELIDVSSGIEKKYGAKDTAKMQLLFENIKKGENNDIQYKI